ncbi:hypothetical protein L596_002009 [Steinernema carpocapsae]|uniref:Uncharacterized protein n=1 Tax=Steinernema carpocapsae TaxID=34508 RepID=A0A4U8UNF3_STECR|nr:hypothetical protein L596_002009 [Steinernema carpocapsae]
MLTADKPRTEEAGKQQIKNSGINASESKVLNDAQGILRIWPKYPRERLISGLRRFSNYLSHAIRARSSALATRREDLWDPSSNEGAAALVEDNSVVVVVWSQGDLCSQLLRYMKERK